MSITAHNEEVLKQLPQKYIEVFREFAMLDSVPRKSGNRAGIVAYVLNWAKEHQFEAHKDDADNVLITVPATKGLENAPGICLQGHTDMVAVKTPECAHDFEKDPISFRIVDGKWLMACDTTLGADDGMGVALAMAIATDKTIKHGPIELLFTSDEEIGLIGASGLKKCLKSKYLLNLDSEDFGDICVSCAGGFRITFEKTFARSAIGADEKVIEVYVHGYLGGHSGAEIQCYRANAIHQLAKVLKQVPAEKKLRLVSISGGIAHNAIPSAAKAVIAFQGECPCEQMKHEFARVNECYHSAEPNAVIEFKELADQKEAWSVEDSANIVDFLLNTPHGPQRFSQDVKDFVETSFATTVLETRGDMVHILGSGRSNYEQELELLYQRLAALGRLCGWKASEMLQRYPGWPAKMDSPLIAITEKAYKKHCDHVRVCAIHAGLEAGMICKLHEGMEAISIGPTILSPHSPQERCEIETVGKSFEIVRELVEDIAK